MELVCSDKIHPSLTTESPRVAKRVANNRLGLGVRLGLTLLILKLCDIKQWGYHLKKSFLYARTAGVRDLKVETYECVILFHPTFVKKILSFKFLTKAGVAILFP